MRGRLGVGRAILLAVLAGPCAASAQPVETVGTRALGMAGAFVAVADDPTAVYWNPAGLAAGPLFGLAIDLQWAEVPRSDNAFANPARGPAGRGSALVAAGTPPLGAAFYRLNHAGLDRRPGRVVPPVPEGVPIARLDTDHLGVSLLQSVGSILTVGGTLKYVRGTAAEGVAGTATSAPDLRDAAADLEGRTGHAFDIDLGVRATAGRFSAGLVIRHLLEPSFDTDTGGSLGLDRQVRAGLAFRMSEHWTVAADADLTITASLAGESRRVAAGLERWWGRRVALRGGVRLETLGDPDPVAALGATLAIRAGLFVDAQATRGASEADLAWGAALRFAY